MKKLLSLLLVLCMLIALGACAGDSTPVETAESTPEATTAPTEETGSEGFDITQYDGAAIEIMWQESDSTQIDIVENFAKAAVDEQFGDYIDITWTGNVDTDYTTLAQTDSLPDIWFGSTTLEMIDSDVILDLTPYLTADTYLQDNFSNPDFFYFKDHIWALSTGVDNFYTGTLYYNKDVFDQLGITSVNTYDELFAACQTLLDNGYDIPLSITGSNNSVATQWLFQAAVVSVSPDAYAGLLTGETQINSTEVTEAIQLIADMRDAGFFGTGSSVKTTSDSVSEFVDGRAAMLYTASWNNGSVSAAEFNVGVAWWPSANADFTTGEYQANWGSPLSGWNARASTEYPELTVEIIKCIVKAEAARHLNAGLKTNYMQDGTPVPVNSLEEQRLALYEEVGTWYKGFRQNTMDATTATTYGDEIASLMSDDSYAVSSFIDNVQAAWEANTFFD